MDLQYLWLTPAGFVIGIFGTLIGAGGGFILVPVLLLVYPNDASDTVTSISLAVVFVNALSGSVSYSRMKRIDYRTAAIFSAATIPGAVLGALTTGYIPRRWFDLVFGLAMVAVAAYLLLRPQHVARAGKQGVPRGHIQRHITEANGATHTFSYSLRTGILLSLAVGYVSSLLGIGGGIIHVPALVNLFDFPVHIATATSQSILAVMSLVGTLVHVFTGAFEHGVRRTIFLALGVLVGAPVGAWLSQRLRAQWIIRGMAVALALVGARLLLVAATGGQ
ncbi:MAG: sulfite exporter TauE/SafE family protein [Chloroflexi bacterium]|nr:sulfite exporter TauE/SafE family protein [Chloroflexota bacterium]